MTGREGSRPRKRSEETHPGEPAEASFECHRCGARVPLDAHRCPDCLSLYVMDVKDEDLKELARAEMVDDDPPSDFAGAHRPSVFNFDADMSFIGLLDDGCTDPGFVTECSHCGTVVELCTSRCPMCGSPMNHVNIGLLDIFTDMDFDPAPFEDADCPYCGEHVTLDSGACPSCGKAVDVRDEGDPTLKVRPVLEAQNVVFLHLDIQTGEINLLRRNDARRRYVQASMHLDGAENGDDRRQSELTRG